MHFFSPTHVACILIRLEAVFSRLANEIACNVLAERYKRNVIDSV